MIVFRLCHSSYSTDLSGRGAEMAGGRWNSKGIALLYTCESRALCTTEIAVHTPLGIIPSGYVLLTLNLPAKATILELSADMLPHHWQSFPYQQSTQQIGDSFVKHGKHLVLKAPSAVVPGDFNYLINPKHKDFNRVKIIKTEAFAFDERLFKK